MSQGCSGKGLWWTFPESHTQSEPVATKGELAALGGLKGLRKAGDSFMGAESYWSHPLEMASPSSLPWVSHADFRADVHGCACMGLSLC
jgi:hypothetical protein